MASETNDSLATKLAKIANELGAIKKTGKNDQQKYSFIEYAEVAGRIRELLDKHHVIVLPAVKDYKVDTVTNKYGGTGYHYTLAMEFTIVNGDKPDDKFVQPWLGESIDYGDKSVNKAETAGTKYFLMRLFQISEKGDESDPDKTTPKEIKSSVPVDAEVKAKEDIANAQDETEVRKIYAKLPSPVKKLVEDDCKNRIAELKEQKDELAG